MTLTHLIARLRKASEADHPYLAPAAKLQYRNPKTRDALGAAAVDLSHAVADYLEAVSQIDDPAVTRRTLTAPLEAMLAYTAAAPE